MDIIFNYFRFYVVGIVMAVCVLVTDQTVNAATFTVVNTNNSGGGSLRQAILDANTASGADVVVFNIPGSGVQTISPTSALPPITGQLLIDGWTQTGFSGTPLIRVDGLSIGSAADGFIFAAGSSNSVLRGMMLTRFTRDGIVIQAPANTITIAGNWIGTTGTGSTSVGNGDDGMEIAGTGAIIGGIGANDRNVITNNSDEGITIVSSGISNISIIGNYIGLDPDGSTGVGNGDVGVAIISGSGNMIGGLTSIARNVISKNYEGIEINTSNNEVQGNYIGTDFTGALDRGNHSSDGVQIQGSSSNNAVGSEASGASNIIAFNAGNGVNVVNGSLHIIARNSIHSNTALGINLGVAGVSLNDVGDGDFGANRLQNFPLLTSANTTGSNITINGSFNSNSSTSYRIEFYYNTIADGSGHGEGQTFFGVTDVTTDGSGNSPIFSILPASVPGGAIISAIASKLDLGDSPIETSEFSQNIIATSTAANVSGTVFEDVNYGGGGGRDRATAMGNDGSLRQYARVELFDNAGNFVSATTTNASGAYTFPSLTSGNYTIRVVNSTVSSSRSGYVAAHRAVQTFRTNAGSGSAVNAIDRVGGEMPGKADAGNGTTTLAALTTPAFEPQSITSVALGGSNINNVDFGYNFNLVVNNNDEGQGSLRQFIIHANALNNAGMATQGRVAGIDHAIFMISNGTSAPGFRATNDYFSGGVSTIVPSSELTWCYEPLILDATTQPGYAGSPLIQLDGSLTTGSANGLTLNTSDSKIAGFIVHSFADDGLEVRGDAGRGGDDNILQSNWVGLNAAGVAAPNSDDGIIIAFAAANNLIGGTGLGEGNVISGNSGDGVQLRDVGSDGNIIQGNLIGTNAAGSIAVGNGGNGILSSTLNNMIGGVGSSTGNWISGNGTHGILLSGATNNTALGNIIGLNKTGNAVIPNDGNGITINGGGTNQIGGSAAGGGNVISGNDNGGTIADGIYITGSTSNIIQGNFIGTDASGTLSLGNFSAGVACDGSNNLIGGTIAGEGNTIRNNGQYGVRVGGSNTGNRILRNSIYNHSLLGIDLNSDGVTYNDNQDTDSGPNAKQNFPKLTSAVSSAGNTSIQGTFNSTPNTTFRIEYFSSTLGDFSGYGEGEVFLGTTNLTTNGAGNATVNALLTGVIVSSGHAVCATATNLTTNNTSEFSAFAYAPSDNDGDGVTDDIDMDDDNDGIPDDIEDLGFDSRGGTIPCTMPGMTFGSPTLVSGSPLSTGSVYRFSTVIPGVDALLTIGTMINASISDLDITTTGFLDAFQPLISFSGLGTPGVEFNIQFVDAGTSTPATSITRFGGTTYDVDGTPQAESFLFYAPSVYAVDQPTLLVHQLVPGAVDISSDGTADGPGISPDPRYRAYYQYKNVNQFNFRCQFKRTTTGTSTRQMCLRFDECFLNDMVDVQLYIIEGSDRDNDGIPDYLDLDSDNDGIYDCVESGSAMPHTNGILNGTVTAVGLPASVDVNNDNAIDYVLSDSDGDNIYDAIEQDSDNDGCTDVVEAGYIDHNLDGYLGDVPLITNDDGVVISGGP